MITSVDHVIVGVGDLDAATDSYTTVLGRRPSWRGVHEAYGTANTLFRLDNSYVELLSPAGDGPVGELLRARLAEHGDGQMGVVFGTDDAAALGERLRARDWEVGEPMPGEGRDTETGAVRRWKNLLFPEARTRGLMSFAIEHDAESPPLPEAAVTESDTSAVAALDHVVVQSTDGDATAAIYGDALGIRLALDKRFEQFGARLIFFRVGHCSVEVAAPLDADTADEPDRFGGLAYRVPDADAAHARLSRAGADVSEVRKGRKKGTRVMTVRAPTCNVPTLLIGPA